MDKIKKIYEKMQECQNSVNYYDEPTDKDEIWDTAYFMGLDCAMEIIQEECLEVLGEQEVLEEDDGD